MTEFTIIKEVKFTLKPCPFCGSDVNLHREDVAEDDYFYMMQCENDDCAAATCFGECDVETFIERYNRRF